MSYLNYKKLQNPAFMRFENMPEFIDLLNQTEPCDCIRKLIRRGKQKIVSIPSESSTSSSDLNAKQFVFPEFDYVQSSKNEIAYKEWMAACQQTPQCLGIQSELNKVRCVRKCMSPSCYYEIYAFDELEEGEIDVRFGSFKGCFIERLARRRRV